MKQPAVSIIHDSVPEINPSGSCMDDLSWKEYVPHCGKQLDNAVKFTPDFGSVTVELAASDGHLTVIIANTGSTIPTEKLWKIWNKFYQGDQSPPLPET